MNDTTKKNARRLPAQVEVIPPEAGKSAPEGPTVRQTAGMILGVWAVLAALAALWSFWLRGAMIIHFGALTVGVAFATAAVIDHLTRRCPPVGRWTRDSGRTGPSLAIARLDIGCESAGRADIPVRSALPPATVFMGSFVPSCSVA